MEGGSGIAQLVMITVCLVFIGSAKAQIGNVTAATISGISGCNALVQLGAQLGENCTVLVDSWIQGYLSGDFTNFFALPDAPALFSVQPNQALFWSGTYTYTHTYDANGTNLYFPGRVTLEATVGGRIFNDLDSDNGLRYDTTNLTEMDNTAPFWGEASDDYASYATGSVYVALGGQSPFRNGSVFESVESKRLAVTFATQSNFSLTVVVFPYSIFTGYTYSDGACINGTPSGSIELLFNRILGNLTSSPRLTCRGLDAYELGLLTSYCNTSAGATDTICSTTAPGPLSTVPPTTRTPAPSTLPPNTPIPTLPAPTTPPPNTRAPTLPTTLPPNTSVPTPPTIRRNIININFAHMLSGSMGTR